MNILKFSFGKTQRLSKVGYQQVFKTGRTVSSAFFLARIAPNQLSFARLGIIIAKKKLAKSTQRHWLKRIVREQFRLNQDKVKGVDMVVLVKRPINTIEKQALKHDLEHLWIKLTKHCNTLSSS